MKRILSIVLLAIFAGCGEKDAHCHVSLDDNFRKAFDFKEGSYWIYRDSVTGKEDSFYVLENNFYPAKDPDGTNCPHADKVGITIDAHSHLLNDTTAINVRLIGSNYLSYTFKSLDGSSYLPYPFVAGSSASGGLFVAQQISSLSLNGITVHNLAAVHQKWNKNIFFISDSIGFVKMRVDADSQLYVWELERYLIKR